MRKIFKITSIVVFSLLISAGCAYKSRDLYNPPPINAPAGKDVKQAIKRAMVDYGWFVEREQPGLIVARQTNRSHEAKVNIHYTKSTVNIKYADSMNLNYKNEFGKETIHTTYNRWVTNLARRINQYLF